MQSSLITIQQILIHTPWWVYVLLVYLIFIGVKARNTGIVSIYKLAVLPLLFLIMSIESMISHFKIESLSISTWLISIIIGSIIGLLLVYKSKIRVDRANKLLELPGSWTTLILILAIFMAKYYCGYALSKDPGAAINTHTEILVLALSGICTGTFIGRMLIYVYRLFKEPSCTLKEKKS